MITQNNAAIDFSSFPAILTIATSDSGGGAGIQADIKTITTLKGFGISLIVALTAQNPLEVKGVYELPTNFINLQFDALIEAFPIKAAKTGMLPSINVINTLLPYLQRKSYPLIVDPVCISQSGFQFLDIATIEHIKKSLIPLATLVTPNLPELEFLSGVSIQSSKDLTTATDKLFALGAKAVLVKGGHFNEFASSQIITDWLVLPNMQPIAFSQPKLQATNNHGTGCTLAAALATFLGFGCTLSQAVAYAQKFLHHALALGKNAGKGCGSPHFQAGADAFFKEVENILVL